MSDTDMHPSRARTQRLPRPHRRRQLLDVARSIVRDDGADQLTLGNLADRAGVSKPVVYDHFETRSALLIELYKWIDAERGLVFQTAMAEGRLDARTTIATLSSTYIQCATDDGGEFYAVGAAMGGSQEKAAVYQELVDGGVHMFVSILQPHFEMPEEELMLYCIALVGAGESLSAAVIRGSHSEVTAVETFARLMWCVLDVPV